MTTIGYIILKVIPAAYDGITTAATRAYPIEPERQLAAEPIEPIKPLTLQTVWTVRLDGPERSGLAVERLEVVGPVSRKLLSI